MKKTFFVFLFLLMCSITQTHAQDTTKTDDPTLSGQYKELLQKSKNNDQGSKIINPSRLSSFQRNYSDSLKQTRSKLAEAQNKITSQNKTINSLKTDLSSKEQSLTESKSRVDKISIVGIGVNKSTYNWIMWSLVILLGAAFAFVVFQSGSYRKEAHYRIKLFSDLSEEFQAFKTKANDKEKRLARELQTEKNRVDDLLKR